VHARSRRGVLLGAAGLAVVACAGGYELIQDGTLPGKYQLAELTGACGAPPPGPAGPLPSQRVVSFYSAYRGRQVRMVTLVPARAAARGRLGVVVALHGADSDALALAGQVGPAMASAHASGLAVICVDGGNTYWHRRADGDDPVGMIMREVLPRARAAGLDTTRIAAVGESMGGYGALLLAEMFGAVTALAALSPALFGSYADASDADGTAFDSQADFARNNVFARVQALRRVPVWVACGSDDPFEAETVAFRTRLAAVTGRPVPGGILPGCHDDAFWARNLPAALRFIAAHLG
jgi:S-formylglutathione hydrolase FrmB